MNYLYSDLRDLALWSKLLRSFLIRYYHSYPKIRRNSY